MQASVEQAHFQPYYFPFTSVKSHKIVLVPVRSA